MQCLKRDKIISFSFIQSSISYNLKEILKNIFLSLLINAYDLFLKFL